LFLRQPFLPLPFMEPLVVAVPVAELDGGSDELPGMLLEPNFGGDAPTSLAGVQPKQIKEAHLPGTSFFPEGTGHSCSAS